MQAAATGFLSVTQFAAREGVSRPRVLQLLAARRIDGAQRIGHHWAIPSTSSIVRRPPGRPGNAAGEPVQRLLRAMARKYVWWLTPAQAQARPDLAITQVMEMGDFDDVLRLETALGRARLAETLRGAGAGRFSARSWHYWHHRLGLAPSGRVPPLPRRKIH